MNTDDASENTSYTFSLSASVSNPSNYDDYIIGNADKNNINGLNGNDRIESGSNDDKLSGGSGNDTLIAQNNNDTLIGGMGKDLLIGGSGSDRFTFNYKTEGTDRLVDFYPPDDVITVSAANFGGSLTPNSFLATAQFYQGSAAHDSSDRFIYNSNHGGLYFDLDGTGSTAKIQIATLNAGLTLTHTDIFVTV